MWCVSECDQGPAGKVTPLIPGPRQKTALLFRNHSVSSVAARVQIQWWLIWTQGHPSTSAIYVNTRNVFSDNQRFRKKWSSYVFLRNLVEIYYSFICTLIRTQLELTWILLELYWNLTGNLLETYWKSTGNLLEIYWNVTGTLLELYSNAIWTYWATS